MFGNRLFVPAVQYILDNPFVDVALTVIVGDKGVWYASKGPVTPAAPFTACGKSDLASDRSYCSLPLLSQEK